MKIFFDLDGTLFNSKTRLYKLFQELVPSSNLTFDDYWKLKMNKIGHKEILMTNFLYTENDILIFEEHWMKNIEHDDWLVLDEPFTGVKEYLEKLHKDHELYIVTARQFENKVISRMAELGWISFFKKILVTNQKKEKVELIKEHVLVSEEDWFVGDTGKDIQTGKQLGMKTAAVLSGFLSRARLEEYNPDVIVNGVLELQFK